MHHAIHAHPRDVQALVGHGGLMRLRDLGFDEVAVAVTEAGGRQVVPWCPDGPIRELEDGVVHFRPPTHDGPLAARASTVVQPGSATPLEAAIVELRRAGLKPWAWARPLHQPRLGRQHPTSCMVDCFGHRHLEALCPARSEVQRYALGLIDALADHDGLEAIELQSLGFLGPRAAVDPMDSALPRDTYAEFLLSVCFCDTCCDSMARTGLDTASIRTKVGELVRQRLMGSDPMSPPRPLRPAEAFRRLERELGEAVLFALWSHRLSVYMQLLRQIRSTVHGRVRIVLHAHFHSLFAGDAVGAPLKVIANHVDEVVIEHVDETPQEIAKEWSGQPTDQARVRAVLQPKAPAFTAPRDLAQTLKTIRVHGGVGTVIHQLGLLPWPALERVGETLRGSVVVNA